MRYVEKRKEAGKMLMDVTKYLLTTALIGGFITDKLDVTMGFVITAISTITFVIALLIIPEKEEA